MELPGLTDLRIDNIIPKDGILEYTYPFIRTNYLSQLIEEIEWSQDKIKMFGKVTPLPRLTAWYGDPNIFYTYSGIKNTPLPWTQLLLDLKKSVEQECKQEFNSVLLNYYRDGKDHMGWHSDNESELGEDPTIASLSFGSERKFQLKHKTDKGIEVVSVNIESGSLLVMKNGIQTHWNHRITKTSKPIGPRINLTFRNISL